MKTNPVIFLPVPDSLRNDRRFFSGPSILLPVEPEYGQNSLDTKDISLEKVLSGMLRVISAPGEYDVPPEWVDYYRNFVLTAKPEIYHEFTVASIVKAKNGEFDMALEISAVLEGLFHGSPGVLLNKALILEKRAQGKSGHDAEVLKAYEEALALEQVLPDTLFNAGFFFMRLGNYKRAKDCFSGFVSAEEEISAEKKMQANKIISNITSQGLDDSNFMEAYDCINNGNDEAGLFKIRKFLEKNPKTWNGWFVLGWALRKQGRYRDGLESFKKAAELGGEGSDLKNEMAICLMETGDFKEAQKELEQALRNEPDSITIISNMGVLAMKTGDNDKAASYFRTVLELDPDDPLAKRFLGET